MDRFRLPGITLVLLHSIVMHVRGETNVFLCVHTPVEQGSFTSTKGGRSGCVRSQRGAAQTLVDKVIYAGIAWTRLSSAWLILWCLARNLTLRARPLLYAAGDFENHIMEDIC